MSVPQIEISSRGPPTPILVISQKGAAVAGVEEFQEIIWLIALFNLPCHQGGRGWHMLLAAELLNTKATQWQSQRMSSLGRCPATHLGSSTGFSLVISKPRLLTLVTIRPSSSGSLKMADNECHMTHATFKQDSGCACEWELLKIPLGCFGSHQSLSVVGRVGETIANFNTNR